MNSSGIKRGLATTAVSALAIAGLPLFASSASAAEADKPMSVAFTGPARNAGDEGALVVIKVPKNTVVDNTANEDITTANKEYVGDLQLAGATNDALDSQNNGSQTVQILDYTVVPDATTNTYGGLDNFDEVEVRIRVTTQAAGDTASFRIFNTDAVGTDGIDASEARANVSVTTAGPVASITIDPNNQTRPVGVQSDDYTVTLRDSAGRLTQFNSAENALLDAGTATVAPNANGTASNETITSDAIVSGTYKFKATGTGAPTVHNITVTSNGTPAIAGNATLSTTAAAAISKAELDIVTDADDWNGFNNAGDATPNQTNLAPTQSKITFNFKSIDDDTDGVADADTLPDDANTTVTLTFTGNGVTFGGADKVTKTVTLDSLGAGSIVLDVDAATIQNADQIAVTGTFAQTLVYGQGTPASFQVPGRYVSALKGTTPVTVKVLDSYGNPVTSGEVSADIVGASSPNINTTTNPDQRKAIAADGTVTFNFTDTKAIAGQVDNIEFKYFTSQFSNTPYQVGGVDLVGTSTIRYTADGQGADYTTTVDGIVASGPGYNPQTNTIEPLTDAVVSTTDPATNVDEYFLLNVIGAEPNTAITLSVDNGALILERGETNLDQASSSISTTTTGAGALPGAGTFADSFKLIGTKTGNVTLTVTNAGRTETSTVVVKQDAADAVNTARNVELTGPTAAVSGDVVTFTAKITDAFGNPVPGFSRTGANNLNVTVSGPGSLQDGSAQSDADGEIDLNVRLFENADSPVTANVTAFGGQFGAAANQRTATSTAGAAPGLTASQSTDSATVSDVTNLEELEAAVEAAEAALAEAQAGLTAAQGDLDVALAQVAVLQSEVDRLKERKVELRKKLNKAKANDNKKKAKTTRKKLRNVKRQLNDAKDALVIAQTAADAAQADVEAAQVVVTEAEEALAQAEQDLEDAQN